jgi:hypothetical protein
MGLGRSLKIITDGIGWAQCIFESYAKTSDGAKWAQGRFKTLLPMTLHGPRYVGANGSDFSGSARGSLKMSC